MRVLLDHCVPRPFGRLLAGHEVRTVGEVGWQGLRNGELLARAAREFDVVVTVDQNIKHQQSVAELPLPVVVMVSRSNRLEALAPLAGRVSAVIASRPGRRVHVVGGK